MLLRLHFCLLSILTGRSLATYLGHLVGALTDTVPGVRGEVWAVDRSTIAISNFTSAGGDPGTFIYAGTLNTDGSYTKTGYPLTSSSGVVEDVPPSSSLLVLHFPEGKSLLTVDWIGVLARRKKKMIGRSLITARVKRMVPKPQHLGRLQGRHVSSGEVTALDSQSVMVRDLVYAGEQPATHFTMGPGNRPGPHGLTLPDEEGSLGSLGMYRNRTIILTLPNNIHLHDMSWFAIWSKGLSSALAWVPVPPSLGVPPSPQSLGLSPQPSSPLQASLPHQESKLNCEVLSPSLGLQLRWSLAGSSIILQIVANLGSEMYMALGVKAGQEEAGGVAAGDVVVGWINTATGQGGLDDYFLSGTVTCSDGAESCPDTTKGGEKNVEMLNSVSRDNYTMLTFRRPLKAEDRYDTTILTSQPQEVFWSVGYKMAEKRMKTKPLKNVDPIFLDFGRLAKWNCPTDGETDNKVDTEEAPRKVVRPSSQADQQGEPSLRRSQGRAPVRRVDYDAYDYSYAYSDGGDYNYDLGSDHLGQSQPSVVVSPPKQEQGFSPADIAQMKKRFEEKLAKDFPMRADGQKTTLELIPELGQFVEPFFPKGPPPGAPRPPQGPPGPATHPPPPGDQNWSVPSAGCNTTENTVFYLQIGPAAAGRGNQGLGRHGQAWYVNGDVAPELYLVRGQEYTFIVEGGLGTDQEGIIHPFYLTSDSEGGYGTKSDYEARMEEVFGGLSVDREGLPAPTIMGRLCQWASPRPPPTYATYPDFKDDLKVNCQETGSPGILRFEPTYDMPDVMYYQSFSEKLLGGRVHLLDQCHEILKKPQGERQTTAPTRRYPTAKPKQNYYTPQPKEFYTPKPKDYYTKKPQEKMYRKPLKENRLPPPAEKKYSPKPKPTKSKRKCPRKLTHGGMPKFEHFPVREILKEGVKDECQGDDDFGAFGGDWGQLDEEYNNGEESDFSDYVQPTKKPLIFKDKFFNDKPLSTRRKYEPRVKKEQLDSGYNQIPDLPKPAFPDMFANMPGGGFMNSNKPKLSVRRPPSSYTTRAPRPTGRPRDRQKVRDSVHSNQVEVTSSGNSGMYRKPADQGYQTTRRPSSIYSPSTTARTSPRPVYTSPRPVYTSERPYGYQTTARAALTTMKQAYDYHTSPRPQMTTNRNPYDYHTTSRDIFTTARPSYDYHTSARPSYTSVYDRNTSPAPRIHHTTPRSHPNSPYKFYSPKPASNPAPLPPPGNFPDFYNKGGMKEREEAVKRTDHERRPSRKPSNPQSYTPLQTFLNPLRSIFGVGGRRREERPVMRDERPPLVDERPPMRQERPPGREERLPSREERPDRRRDPEDAPAPLAPPRNFPEFPETNDLSGGRRRRRKKRPRRPFVDLSQKKQLASDEGRYQDMPMRRPAFDGGRRIEEGRPQRPLFRKKPRRGYRDQMYSPSDQEDMVVDGELSTVLPSPATNLGLGVFNPRAIVSESGFTPVMPNSGNAPSLAFSIFDESVGGTSGLGSGSSMMDRMDSFYGMETTGDRGNVMVDIPGQDILPYTPRATSRSLRVGLDKIPSHSRTADPWENLIKRNTGSSIEAREVPEVPSEQTSADFHSFQTIAGQEDNLNVRQVHDIHLNQEQVESGSPLLLSVGSSLSYGPQQPSRVGSSVAVGSVGQPDHAWPVRQMLTTPDGTSLAYGNHANYGKQHPSFVQQDVHTTLGNSASKQLDTSKDVVYGKVSETPSAPMDRLEKLDLRLLEKLALLEGEGKSGAEAVVSDLWSIMEQNEG